MFHLILIIVNILNSYHFHSLFVDYSAAAKGSLKRLQSFQLAGANLSQSDFSNNTALHIVSVLDMVTSE
jgi:hypothetical protein